MGSEGRKRSPGFGLGLVAGVLGGVILGRKLAVARRMPGLSVWQRVLAEKRGEVEAAMLAARIQARYDELYAHRPHFANVALRAHLEGNILPGLALYQVLSEESEEPRPQAGASSADVISPTEKALWVCRPQTPAGHSSPTTGRGILAFSRDDQETVLGKVEELFLALYGPDRLRKLMSLLERLPGSFATFRKATRWVLQFGFPPEGWDMEPVEDSEQTFAFNVHRCFYLDVLTAYGAPELTPLYCKADDWMAETLPAGISWARTKTLGQGDEVCNFRWCHTTSKGPS